MILNSSFRTLCAVSLPFAGRQFYMHALDISAPSVPKGFEDYLPQIERILSVTGLKEGTAFLTVDEKVVKAGSSQRRPGPHVDGCFKPDLNYWGHGGGGWNHYCNHLPTERMSVIVAASVPGCRVWSGKFEGEPRNDGDLSHLSLPDGELVSANMAHWLSPDCVHESLVFDKDTARTFIRLAMPVGSFH